MEKRHHHKKLGLALVGLGHYATDRVAVGLEASEYWHLAAIVTGSREKIPAWQEKWKIPDDRVFSYKNFDHIEDCPDIDAVYICLPNNMHADLTVRAARAGKHVIVEKPIATCIEEAEQMIAACDAAKVKLAIGYRLRFNSLHQEISRGGPLVKGKVNFINAIFSIDVGEPEQWRLKKSLAGGGALIDVGIYCIQAARYLTGQEPVSVTAQFGPCTDAEKFREVEEHISWQMRFANDIYVTGYAGYSGYLDELCIRTSEHLIKLEPAFSYGPLAGSVRNGEEHAIRHTHEHQQWKQMEELGKLFLDPAPLPDFISGSEGLRDLKIISAIYDAANSGQEVIF